MYNMSAKNIIITGASSGIGKACAIACSNAGAKVHLIARYEAKLKETVSQLGGTDNTYHGLDVTDSDKIEPVIKKIVEQHGKIYGFIHSAGIQKIQPLRSIDKAHYMSVFALNTIAAFDFCRVLIKKAYSGDIGQSFIFISSVMSVAADAGLTSYCASKAALVGGARAMAIELAPKNIRVNCVSPGTVENTAMTEGLMDSISNDEFERIVKQYPMGLGDTQDIAKLCVFLLSEDAKWITGQNIVIDGGYSVK